MENEIVCSCGQRLHVPDALIGKKGRCPSCNAVIDFSTVGPSAANAPAEYYVPVSKPAGPQSSMAPPFSAPPVSPYTGRMVSRHQPLRSIGVTCAVLLFVLAAFYLIYFISMMAGPLSYGGSSMMGFACGAGVAALMMVALLVTFGVWWMAITRGAADLADTADECERLVQRM